MFDNQNILEQSLILLTLYVDINTDCDSLEILHKYEAEWFSTRTSTIWQFDLESKTILWIIDKKMFISSL